ncbi:MAG TPA: tyrosine recombinase XerD, partial [Verrucomicrobiales bacterium]|nr:tyrosine recombinase XerD [Verrucomicrobiales bacterium]
MQALIEDFGQYLHHERGQSEHTQKAYCNILNRFADWAKGKSIERWNEVTLTHLLSYLQHQREDSNPEPVD